MIENYFTEAMGFFTQKVIEFNDTFSLVVIQKILIKYLLHASHGSPCQKHVGGYTPIC